jgi:hypothetical protein
VKKKNRIHCKDCNICIDGHDHVILKINFNKFFFITQIQFKNLKIIFREKLNNLFFLFSLNKKHCPWVGKCIGKDNSMFFFSFLFATVVYFVVIMTNIN